VTLPIPCSKQVMNALHKRMRGLWALHGSEIRRLQDPMPNKHVVALPRHRRTTEEIADYKP
jgi:hypothetical protein